MPLSIQDKKMAKQTKAEYDKMMKDAQLAMDRAKINMMRKRNSVFITTVLFSLKMQWDSNIPTAGTDAIGLWVNPKYFLSLSDEERIFLLFHETWHVCWNHMSRGRDLNHKKYNRAGDYVINQMAVDNGYTMPKGGLQDDQYKGMSTREVYDLLPDPEENDGGDGSMGSDIIYDPAGKDPDPTKQMDITTTIMKAMTQAKLAGNDPGSIPGELRREIENIIHPKLPWQALLQNFMTEFAKTDYSWKRPNRRYQPDFYMPSLYGESIGHVATAVDTSGSVTNEEFTSFLTELTGIKEQFNPSKMTIIDFDTNIKKIHVLEEDMKVADIEFTGYGGTDIGEVWEWGKKTKPLVLIIFSDMEFTHPTENLPCPVLWICVNNERMGDMPFGKTIHMDTSK